MKKDRFKSIKEFLHEEESIPGRFALLNGLLLVDGFVTICSKNIWVKATAFTLGNVGAFLMNREMAKFMMYMMDKR